MILTFSSSLDYIYATNYITYKYIDFGMFMFSYIIMRLSDYTVYMLWLDSQPDRLQSWPPTLKLVYRLKAS